MQLTTLILALLFAHFAGDFVLQNSRVVAGKREQRFLPHLEHASVHLLLSEAALLVFVPEVLGVIRNQAILAGMIASHALVDFAKVKAERGAPAPSAARMFFVDQGVHFLFLLAAAVAIDGNVALFGATAEWARQDSSRILLLATSYTSAVFAAGHANAMLLAPYADRLKKRSVPSEHAGLENAGKYIGWLERFLILTAVLARSPEAVGLVAAAKSVFRFGDIKEAPALAEYFLVGTFLSISEAVGVGLLTLFALNHL